MVILKIILLHSSINIYADVNIANESEYNVNDMYHYYSIDNFKLCSVAKIIALNKITAQKMELTMNLNEPQYFDNIEITAYKCVKNLDQYNPDNQILITVYEYKADDDKLLIFKGWIINSDASISLLEHPIYEVFAKDCI
ncbi:MAG: DUF2155 domain-containing protein [Rickettsiaceae bacterium]